MNGKDTEVKAGVDVEKIPDEIPAGGDYIDKYYTEQYQYIENSRVNWRDKFKRLDKLEVDLGASGAAIIFGNGRNQVGVIVRIKITGKNNFPMQLEPSDILPLVKLCDFRTGQELPFNSSEPPGGWSFDNKPGKFVKPVYRPHSALAKISADTTPDSYDLHNGVSGDGTVYVLLYLYSTREDEPRDIAALINLPGVGPFNSSKVPTSTTNAPAGQPGSIWNNPSFVTCEAIRQINYSEPENIEVTNAWKSFDDFNHKVSDMLIENLRAMTHSYQEGTSSVAELKIKTKNGYRFKEKNVHRNRATNSFMNICGYNNTADIIWGRGGENFDTDLIFAECSYYGLAAPSRIFMESKFGYWFYVVGPNDHRHTYSAELSDEYVLISICNHRCPNNNLWKLLWSNSHNEIIVDVCDEYGNYGQLKISMHDQNWPRLKINGKYW